MIFVERKLIYVYAILQRNLLSKTRKMFIFWNYWLQVLYCNYIYIVKQWFKDCYSFWLCNATEDLWGYQGEPSSTKKNILLGPFMGHLREEKTDTTTKTATTTFKLDCGRKKSVLKFKIFCSLVVGLTSLPSRAWCSSYNFRSRFSKNFFGSWILTTWNDCFSIWWKTKKRVF